MNVPVKSELLRAAKAIGHVPTSNPVTTGNLASYWTNQVIRIHLQGPDRDEWIQLNKPYVRLGSHPRADISIDHASVRRRHMLLLIVDEQLYSLNFAAGATRGKQSGFEMVEGRALQCGEYSVTATIVDSLVNGPAEPVTHRIVNRFSAQIERRGKPTVTYPVNTRIIGVGRNRSNRICISSRRVSEFHCALFDAGDAIWAIDLMSGNGTDVDDLPIECRRLLPGSTLRIGNTRMTFPIVETKKQTIEPPVELSCFDQPNVVLPTCNTKPVEDAELAVLQEEQAKLIDDRNRLSRDRLSFSREVKLWNELCAVRQQSLSLIKQEQEESRGQLLAFETALLSKQVGLERRAFELNQKSLFVDQRMDVVLEREQGVAQSFNGYSQKRGTAGPRMGKTSKRATWNSSGNDLNSSSDRPVWRSPRIVRPTTTAIRMNREPKPIRSSVSSVS